MKDEQLGLLTPTPLEPDQELEFARAVSDGFHEGDTDEQLQRWADLLSKDGRRAWVVRDRGRVVANLGVLPTDLSLPGGARIGNAGITMVGVAQTHRRRGLLRSMMAAALDEATSLGEPVATLYASEGPIYGRFGFGGCSHTLRYRIDRGIRFRGRVDVSMVEPVDGETAVRDFPAIFERFRDQRSSVGQLPGQWDFFFGQDPPDAREGASPLRLITVPGRGYAAYRVKADWSRDSLPNGTVKLRELVATDPEAEEALWQHVCDIDLTSTVETWVRPVDDALLELVSEPIRIRASLDGPLYARLLDVATALSSRSYEVPGRTVLQVLDRDRDQSGTYRLDVSDDGVSCQRVGDREPDLELDIEALSSVWLGGVRTTQLVAARRVVEQRRGAAAAFDRLLHTPRAPWTPFMF